MADIERMWWRNLHAREGKPIAGAFHCGRAGDRELLGGGKMGSLDCLDRERGETGWTMVF